LPCQARRGLLGQPASPGPRHEPRHGGDRPRNPMMAGPARRPSAADALGQGAGGPGAG